MTFYTSEVIERAQAVIAAADREFADYSRTDLLLDNLPSLRNVEDARDLLTTIGAVFAPRPSGKGTRGWNVVAHRVIHAPDGGNSRGPLKVRIGEID